MKSSLPADKLPIGFGTIAVAAALILLGVALSPTAVEFWIIPDMNLAPGKNRSALQALRACLIGLGVFWLWRGPRWKNPWLAAAICLLLVPVIVAGAYGTYQRSRPAPWKAPGLSTAERLVIIADNTLMHTGQLGIKNYRRLLQLPLLSHSTSLRFRHAVALLQEGDTNGALHQLKWIQARLAQNPDPELDEAVQRFLAIANLRKGEQENCIARHTNETCIVPIRLAGQHLKPAGSQRAIEILEEILAGTPDDAGARWLLNIAYMTIGGYPQDVPEAWRIPESAFASEAELAGFVDIAPRTGVDVTSIAGGIVIEDFDQDGYLDLIASTSHDRGQVQYFHNDGNGAFSNRTVAAGLIGQVGGLNMSHADYDNDGFPDVLILRGGWRGFVPGNGDRPNTLLRNRGDGTFEDVTEAAGLLTFHPSQTAAWADYDNDGSIDVFIGNESGYRDAHRSQLYHNNGDGTFSEVGVELGLEVTAFVKGATWGDYDNDGDPDLYVSVYGGDNLLFRNDGDNGQHTFENVAPDAGVEAPRFSFPTWFWDFNNDGWQDIFVAGFAGRLGTSATQTEDRASRTTALRDIVRLYLNEPIEFSETPRLYRNNKDGTFTEVSTETHLNRAIFVMGANFGDIDNDGFPDVYLGTGEPSYEALLPNLMFRSDRGVRFQNVTTVAGVGHIQKGHGIAFADIDNDGDQDVYAQVGGWYGGDSFPNALFQNPGNTNHWLTVRLRGVKSNRNGIGVRIRITVRTADGERDIYATAGTGGSFGSSSVQQEIGLGQAESIKGMTVTWPTSNTVQEFTGIERDRIVLVREDSPTVTYLPQNKVDM